jgi:hypothetical protein
MPTWMPQECHDACGPGTRDGQARPSQTCELEEQSQCGKTSKCITELHTKLGAYISCFLTLNIAVKTFLMLMCIALQQ